MNWELLSKVADTLGIISAGVGIFTFGTTLRIRKSLLKHTEKRDYMKDIDNKINDLLSYYETLSKDDSLYTLDLLDLIVEKLTDIIILYETILPKKILGDISKLIDHIKKNCCADITNTSAKRECKQKIHSIITKLKKEKGLL